MEVRKKRIVKILVIVVILIVVMPFVANRVVERKITNKLKDLPKHIMVEYADVEADVVRGNLKLLSPNIVVKGKVTDEVILEARLNDLEINDLSYWDYLVNNKIFLDDIHIREAVVRYKHNQKVEKQNYGSNITERFKKEVNVKHITIADSDILIKKFETDSIILSLPQLNAKVAGLTLSPKNSKAVNPFAYDDFLLNGKNLKWALGDYENLSAAAIEISKDSASFEYLKLKTKYSKGDYSSMLKVERDHFDLSVQKMQFNTMDFGFNVEDTFYFNSDVVNIVQPNAEIYRDKLLADDLSQKSLYGKMLRDMNFDLGIDTVQIVDGELTYEEKTKPDKKPGVLEFRNLDAKIKNFGNTFGNADTTIDINSEFMEDSPLEVNWNFKVQDSTDRFTFKADIGELQAVHMNQFTEPNLNVRLEGILQQTYFTVDGNPFTSNTDLKMKYDDFKVAVLKDNGKERKTLLSGIINLFISNDSNGSSDGFRYGEAEQVERDHTKSVFNFVWLNIKDALLSAMAGDGEKDD